MSEPETRTTDQKKNRIYHIIYAAMGIILLIMLIYAARANRGLSLGDQLSEGNTDFAEGWHLADGSGADITHLNNLPSVEPYQEQSVYHELPDQLDEGLSLCFRAKNVYYQVYVDGELRYEPKVRDSAVYNKSLGTRWNYVPLYSGDAGKTVELRFYTVYADSRACIDHICLGEAAGEIIGVFTEKMGAFSTCLLILFAGVLLIIADIPSNLLMGKQHEMLYLGLFAISIAIWCLAETNLLQFFTDDSRLLQFLSCTSLIMIPIPLVLYIDAAFDFIRRMVVPVICGMSAAEFVLCAVLHFTGIRDYHGTLTFSHIMLAIAAVLLLYALARNAYETSRGHAKNAYWFMRTLGLTGISFAALLDIIRFYQGNNNDAAKYVRIGLLVFIVCYGCSSLEKMVNAVRLGVESEIVSQLAYQDGLTGVGNRTAFQERLEELEKEKSQLPGIAVMMFDVNDLKLVNDNQGHQKGDQLLVSSAEIIRNAIESVEGTCYRIGGDEFAGVVSFRDAEERCKRAVAGFTEAMNSYNAIKGQPFHISIASGYAVYDRQKADEKLMDVYQRADDRMYENKKQMKAKKAAAPHV